MQISIQDVTSIITAAAAAGGVILAVNGFDAWKDQLRGSTDYELARRYLRAVYKIRDAMKFVRNPFIPVEEINTALEGRKAASHDDRREINSAVYSLRWKRVVEAGSDLNVELLEAEVSWGKEAIDAEKDFEACINKLFVALRMFTSVEGAAPNRDLIYDQGEGDQFNKDVDSAIKKIEKYLSPHLR